MEYLSANITMVTNASTDTDNAVSSWAQSKFRQALFSIYSAVLLLGSVGAVLMARTFKSSRSVIAITVINLTLAHSLFLITVPFRLYYYAEGRWDLGRWPCHAVSGMIHIHMCLTFLFYAVIIALRIWSYYSGENVVRFYRNMHALLASLAVWIFFLLVLPLMLRFYGNQGDEPDDHKCFHFARRMGEGWVKVCNYVLSLVISLSTCTLAGLQLHVLGKLWRQKGQDGLAQQELMAQVKSFIFILVLLVCFVPYQLFRLYYLEHLHQEEVNELFLSLTALSCFDMLIFSMCWGR